MNSNKLLEITGSIVLYNSNPNEIKEVIKCFNDATLTKKMYLIDNSEKDDLKILEQLDGVEYIFVGKNIGYGAGHNIAINRSIKESAYHVVLNPDISFNGKVLDKALMYMEENEDVGLLSPRILYPDGSPQYMCRLLPTPFDLIARRFLPNFAKAWFQSKLESYTLSGLDYEREHNIPNLPGSFMFLRNGAVEISGGFDEKFFMYLEDIDLTRRIHQYFRTIYSPDITITHALEQGSYKSSKLLKYHIQSAFYYFKKWGWFVDHERNRINTKLMEKLANVQR